MRRPPIWQKHDVVCLMPSRVKGPPLKCGLRLLILLAKALPKQKPISFQSLGSLELPVGLDFAMSVGFFFFTTFPKPPKNVTGTSGRSCLSIREQQVSKSAPQMSVCPTAALDGICVCKDITWTGSLGGGQQILEARWQPWWMGV